MTLLDRRPRVAIDHDLLRARLRSAYARDRLAEALYAIALDAFDPSPSTTAAELEWLRNGLERPLRVATEAALGTFAAEVERSLVGQSDHA